MPVLALTSPHTKGIKVKELQNLLAKNPYGSFYKEKVDGEFGPYTGLAVKEAKFWLGYAPNRVNEQAGDLLVSLLNGTRKLPLMNQLRRKRRLDQQKKIDSDMHLRALNSAISYIGTAEDPLGSNNVMFSRWYGMIDAWCAMFCTYNYVTAGSKAFQRGNRWAYCPFVVDDARAGRNGLRMVSDPNPGDLVLFDWNGDGTADHIGIFEGWKNKKKSSFTSIEGNTGAGVVDRCTHDTSNVLIFARVLY